MVLRLIRDLPGDHAWLPPSPREIFPARFSACIGAPGPHDFAVRRHAARHIDIARVHRIPPHVRDDAYAPLAEAGREKEATLRSEEKADYFLWWIWTIPIELIRLANFVFRRRRFLDL
jgi:hypothetical protein